MILNKIKKCIVLTIVISSLLVSAEASDSDFDGVPDNIDKCPNSKITDIVNKDGCMVKKLHFKSTKLSSKKDKRINKFTYLHSKLKPFKIIHPEKSKLTLIAGVGYEKSDSNTSANYKSFSVVYNYDKLTALASYSHSKIGEAINDLTLAVYYTFTITPQSTFELGTGSCISLNSKKDNRTDYFLSAKYNYYFKKYNIGIKYEHTFMRDFNTKDTNLFNISFGMMLNKKLYLQLSYETQNALYRDTKRVNTIGLYANYSINKHWFISTELTKDIRDSNTYSANFNIGYNY